MKRVLCLLSGMNAGGAETYLMKIYRALDKERYQMDFCINVVEKCFYEDEILDMEGKIYRIPSKSENIKEFKKQLSYIVSENQYEYVLRVTSSAMGFMDLKIAKKAGARVCIARSSNSSDGGSLKSWIVHQIGQLLYEKYVDVKIAPSDLAAMYTFGKRTYEKRKVNILHNAIDVEKYQFDRNKRYAIRDELGIPKDALVVGHIGRFSNQKNHDYLIEVFREIHKQNEKTLLLLVGKGELETTICNKVKNFGLESNVIFAGVRSDIPSVLSAMDVFLFPSFYEGMPNTIIEAQANGLPCIIADTITKGVNITGLVHYLSLSSTTEEWARRVLSVDMIRCDQSEKFKQNRYEISLVVRDFVKLIFGD